MNVPKIMDIINKIITPNGTITSAHADYAEIGEWSDGNPNGESRIGYFVSVDTSESGVTMVKATSTSDVRGVTMTTPGYAANATKDKFDINGNLKNKYAYVGFAGFIPVIDNGTCTINGRCMPADDGTAIPSTNNLGYQVIDRVDDTHVLILVEPQGDMIQRIKTEINNINNAVSNIDQQLANKNPKIEAVTETLSTSWTATSGGFTQEISSISGVTVDSVLLIGPAPESYTKYSECGIRCTAQGSGSLTFFANKAPNSSLSVQILILR